MEEFGVLSLLLLVSAFLMYIFTLGSFQLLFKYIAERNERSRATFWSALLITSLISTTCIVVVLTYGSEIAALMNLTGYEDELVLSVTLTATTSLMMVLLYYHYGLSRNNFQNVLQFLRGSLWILATITISFFFDLSLYQVFVAMNVAMIFILLLSIPWKESSLLLPIELNKGAMSNMMAYCLPLLPYFAGAWGIPLIARGQLNIHNGPKDVAIFSVAYALMEIVLMFISTIVATVSPHFFADDGNDRNPRLLYNIMLKYSIVCILLIVPFIFMLRYDIIRLVASEKYIIAGNYIPILTLFPLLRVLIIVFEQQLLKTSKTIYLGTIYSAAIVICLLLCAVLIPKYSILGAIYASLGSYLFIFLLLSVKQRGIIDFGYLRLSALLKLAIALWVAIWLLHLFDLPVFFNVPLLTIVALTSLLLFPVFDEWEKEKLFLFLKLKK